MTGQNDTDDDSDDQSQQTVPHQSGLFSGADGRLIYVDRSGSLTDYSGATLGMNGIVGSRLGVRFGEEVHWFDELETTRQRYDGETTLIRTEHAGPEFTIQQWDYTLQRSHLTHVELFGDVQGRGEFVAALEFAPDREREQVGQFAHGDVVEVFHDIEHNYVSASNGIERTDLPGGDPDANSSISNHLTVAAPFEQDGKTAETTLVSLIANHSETDRADALAHVRAFADHYQTGASIRDRASALESMPTTDLPNRESLVDDLRAIRLLTASTGARTKLPSFDTQEAGYSGTGYTWFRDDAEIADNLLRVDDAVGVDLTETHEASAQFYCETQLPDGTWPQRVWTHNGSIAPGWAQARVTGNGNEYQADATAGVLTFLARYLGTHSMDPSLASDIEETIETGLTGLLDLLDADGMPSACQNLWEEETGRFTHTAATVLKALSAVANAPLGEDERSRAREHADRIYEGLASRWTDRGVFERAPGDDGLDVSTLSLLDAHSEYADLDGLDTTRLDRLREHYETTIAGLRKQRDSQLVGLVRYERDSPDEPETDRLWPLAAAWAGSAGATLGELLAAAGRETAAEELFEHSKDVLRLTISGPFTLETGYLPEQQFADGTPNTVTPFGWAHAVRCGALAKLFAAGELASTEQVSQPSGPAARTTWTTGEKYGVGTACDHHSASPSRVWFTLTEGALTEPRFPRVDLLNFRTVDFLVVDTGDDSAYVARTHNERRTDDDIETIERSTTMSDTSAPVYRQEITETGGHRNWEIAVEYITDPDNDTILMDLNFRAIDGNQYDVYVIGDVALSGYITGTEATRIEESGGYAVAASDADDRESVYRTEDGEDYETAAAIATQRSFDWASVCTAGDETLAALYDAEPTPNPNVETGPGHSVLIGRLGAGVQSLVDTIAIGFAEHADTETAYEQARASLDNGYVDTRDAYVSGWHEYLEDRPIPESVASYPDLANQYRAAMIVLKAVEDKTFLGAGIASPSVPWGDDVPATGPNDYGYNFTWSRDLYQVFTALSAMGDVESARLAVEYLYEYQQRPNGFLPQNTYLEGRTRWGGEQLDNIAFPAVMAYQLAEDHGLDFEDVDYEYENVRRSTEYVLRSGPRSGQERWEEESGYSPSTIAAQVAGLGCAAALANSVGERADALTYLAFADEWRLAVDDWCATESETDGDRTTPYYVRVSRNGEPDSGVRRELANNGPTLDERDIVDAGFLELVRLGLRDPDEQIVENSLEVVDETIRVDTPNGPAWYRYNGDGYGELGEIEDEEGAPWSMAHNGRGRLWPIFTGERAEYELLAGTESGELAPKHLLWTMQRFANDGRMIPEQVWDREYETEYGWEFGEGTGAATPLAWSMAQYVRLAHGLDAGAPVETPAVLDRRYGEDPPDGPALTLEDVVHDGERVHLSGETDAHHVVLWTPETTETVDPTGGEFTVTVPANHEQCAVVGATQGEKLHRIGTTIEERSW